MTPAPRPPKSETEAVTRYRPFVIKTARHFRSAAVAEEDLIQEGLLAVAVAFRRWRLEGGANFLTWIRRPVYYAMLKLVREQYRAGGSFRGGGKGARKMADDGVTFVSFEEAPTRDFDGPWEGSATMHDVVGTFEEPADCLALEMLPDFMFRLDEQERKIIRMRLEGDLTYTQIGAKLRIQRALVRQIEQQALARLKDMMAQATAELEA